MEQTIANFGDLSGQKHVGGRRRDTHTADKVRTHGHTLLFYRYRSVIWKIWQRSSPRIQNDLTHHQYQRTIFVIWKALNFSINFFVCFCLLHSVLMSMLSWLLLPLLCSSNAHATKVKRKTLLGNDVLAAMNDMEFEHFIPDLKESLAGEKNWRLRFHIFSFKPLMSYRSFSNNNVSWKQTIECRRVKKVHTNTGLW